MIRLLICGHSFANRIENRLESVRFSGHSVDMRVVGVSGGSILQIDWLLSMARRRYPEFRPHFVILFLGGNDVLSWNGQTSLAFEMARVCAYTLAQTGALDVWIASLFARGSSRWNPDPVIFNSMAGLVNTHLSREIRALDSQHLHILRHRCAANTNDSRSQDRCFLYVSEDGTHLSREGWRSLLSHIRRQLSRAVSRLIRRGILPHRRRRL